MLPAAVREVMAAVDPADDTLCVADDPCERPQRLRMYAVRRVEQRTSQRRRAALRAELDMVNLRPLKWAVRADKDRDMAALTLVAVPRADPRAHDPRCLVPCAFLLGPHEEAWPRLREGERTHSGLCWFMIV